MKISKLTILIYFITFCIQDAHATSPVFEDENPPVVNSEAKFNIAVEDGVVYATGLCHQSINSKNYTTIPLKLDVYFPKNNIKNRPLIMLIHGGSYMGGSRKNSGMVNMADYFAQRGWVAISIDYRLKSDLGTVPQEWVDYFPKLESLYRFNFLSVYPAIRDAKAALRWVVANADKYNINTDYITVGGSSAGAVTAIAIGVTNEEDYRDELSMTKDPSLVTTNLDQSYRVQTILDFWGLKKSVYFLEILYCNKRFDSTDAPMLIAHGTKDSVIPLWRAEELKTIYESNGVSYVFYPLDGFGHGAWHGTYDGKSLQKLSFNFIVEQQKLIVE